MTNKTLSTQHHDRIEETNSKIVTEFAAQRSVHSPRTRWWQTKLWVSNIMTESKKRTARLSPSSQLRDQFTALERDRDKQNLIWNIEIYNEPMVTYQRAESIGLVYAEIVLHLLGHQESDIKTDTELIPEPMCVPTNRCHGHGYGVRRSCREHRDPLSRHYDDGRVQWLLLDQSGWPPDRTENWIHRSGNTDDSDDKNPHSKWKYKFETGVDSRF